MIAMLALTLVLAASAWAATPTTTVIYNFPCNEGYPYCSNNVFGINTPASSLIFDTAGNLYGTAAYNGTYYEGGVFKLTPPTTTGGTWTETDLYDFGGVLGDGAQPMGSLTLSGGNLYGTASGGGFNGGGTVFELSPPKTEGGAWTQTDLYEFCSAANCTDGATPLANVLLIGGKLYGTTSAGGANGYGTVFELIKPTKKGLYWTLKVLSSFTGGSDGANPMSNLSYLSGNFYGSTYNGGANGYGVIFELKPSGTSWSENVLYTFTGAGTGGADAYPTGPLVLTGGNIYGTAYGVMSTYGAYPASGEVFELKPSGSTWTENVLYTFTGGVDGGAPVGGVVKKGTTLYGTTFSGGTDTCGGFCPGDGVVYKLTYKVVKTKGVWTESVLADFDVNINEYSEQYPMGALVLDKSGNLYGTTSTGGANFTGTVFETTP
jgi:uncharacterized repeat protein (TIGR03803 family)